jgi:hypothetical protein
MPSFSTIAELAAPPSTVGSAPAVAPTAARIGGRIFRAPPAAPSPASPMPVNLSAVPMPAADFSVSFAALPTSPPSLRDELPRASCDDIIRRLAASTAVAPVR